jgi:TolB-like protein/Tfp pilus assembly protein PilF
LRTALDDPAEASRFIETEPRRGYRFVAPVEVELASPVQTETPFPRNGNGRPTWLAKFAAAALAVGIVLWLVAAPIFAPESVSTSSKRLAVLPFEELSVSTSDEDRFADALTDELVVRLTALAPGRLGVVAHTSSTLKQPNEAALDFGRRLGVDYVVHGTVRKSDRDARVNVKLSATNTGEHLWARSLTVALDESLFTHARLSRSIVAGVRPLIADLDSTVVSSRGLDPSGLSSDDPRAALAYDAYLRGRYHLNGLDEERIDNAIVSFREALRHAPRFARAHLGLAQAHVRLAAFPPRAPTARRAYREAKRAAEQALRLDPTLAEAHLQLALATWFSEWSWAEAEASFERGLEVNPGIASLHHWYAYYLSAVGRHEESLTAVQRARELDPLSRAVTSDVGLFYYFARQPERAIVECRRTLELEPEYTLTRHCLLEAYRALGDWNEAAEQALVLMRDSGWSALEDLQPTDVLDELDRHRAGAHWKGSPYLKAISLARMGETERAFEELDRAISLRSPWVVVVDIDPSLAVLRTKPRYAHTLEQLNFPEAARARNARVGAVGEQRTALH